MLLGIRVYSARQPAYKSLDQRLKTTKAEKAKYEKRHAYYEKRKKAGLSVG